MVVGGEEDGAPADAGSGMDPASLRGSTASARPSPADAERLSAWLDGELEIQAAAPLIGELLLRRQWQQQYEDWCMVGDALRSHEVAAGNSPRLCARITRALEDEPALLAPRALPNLVKRHLATGIAVAAAVAVLALVAVPQLRGDAGGAASGTLASGAREANGAPAAMAGEANSPGNPGDRGSVALASEVPRAHPARNARLDPYLQAHRDFAGVGVMPAAAVYLRFGSEGER